MDIDRFQKPGHYIRYWNEDRKEFIYTQLLEREGPLRYPYEFAKLTTDTESSAVSFEEIDPNSNHFYQLLLGVRDGVKYRLWHPVNEKMFLWDDKNITDIDEGETANIQYEDSPYEDPKLEIWVIPKQYPAVTAQRIQHQTVLPGIIFMGMKFNYREVIDPTLLDNLNKGRVPSTPISWKKIT